MGFSRQEYRIGLPFPSPGDLPDPGIEPWSPTLQADSLPSEPPGKPLFFLVYAPYNIFGHTIVLKDHTLCIHFIKNDSNVFVL